MNRRASEGEFGPVPVRFEWMNENPKKVDVTYRQCHSTYNRTKYIHPRRYDRKTKPKKVQPHSFSRHCLHGNHVVAVIRPAEFLVRCNVPVREKGKRRFLPIIIDVVDGFDPDVGVARVV